MFTSSVSIGTEPDKKLHDFTSVRLCAEVHTQNVPYDLRSGVPINQATGAQFSISFKDNGCFERRRYNTVHVCTIMHIRFYRLEP